MGKGISLFVSLQKMSKRSNDFVCINYTFSAGIVKYVAADSANITIIPAASCSQCRKCFQKSTIVLQFCTHQVPFLGDESRIDRYKKQNFHDFRCFGQQFSAFTYCAEWDFLGFHPGYCWKNLSHFHCFYIIHMIS